MFKTIKRFPSSSKNYRRRFSIIRFVDDPGIIMGVNKGNRWYNKRKSTSNNAN